MGSFFDDQCGERDIGGDDKIACSHLIDNMCIGDVKAMRNLDGADEFRWRRAQHLVGDQRRRDLTPLGGTIDNFLDDAGAGIGIDPDVHGDLQLR